MKTRVISISSQKGGVGKTMTSVNLAAWLALLGRRVLLIDLDPQGSSSRCYDIHGKALDKGGLKDLFEAGSLNILRKQLPKKHIYTTPIKNLWVLPANVEQAQEEVMMIQQALKDPDILKNIVDLCIGAYDFILIDTPPSLATLPRMALSAADSVLIPLQSEHMALSTIPRLLELIHDVKSVNRWLSVEGILLTMFDSRVPYCQQLLEQSQKSFEEMLFSEVIPRDPRLSEATAAHRPVVLYDMNTPGSKAYRSIAERLIGRWSSASGAA